MKMQYLSKHVSDIALGTVDIVWRTMTVVELLVWITALFCQLATYTAYSLPVYDCTFINYCQPPTSDWWKCRSIGYFRCPSGKKYHCAKDYDYPEVFKEGCATEKFCQEGEEPFLSFKRNGRQVNEPEVYCRTCADKDRYNNRQNTSSAEYSECPDKKWNICTEEDHKKLCKPETSTEERFCRCDARNGFYPMNDNSNQKCSYKDYDCGHYRNNKKCRDDEELLLNYTCAAKCDEGFARFYEDNDNCDQLLSVKQKNILILSTPKTIDNGTTTVPSTKTPRTECDEECEEYQICDSGKCMCLDVCAAVYDPVCGYHEESDTFDTFSSKCKLERHYCQNRKFVFYTNGECKKHKEKDCDEECEEYKICDNGKCVCREVCAAVYDPVCGYHEESDTFDTFSSKCKLERSYCQHRKFVFYDIGECKKDKEKDDPKWWIFLIVACVLGCVVPAFALFAYKKKCRGMSSNQKVEESGIELGSINKKEKVKNQGENQSLTVNLTKGQNAQSNKTDNNVQDQDPATADNTSNKKDADVNIESAIGEEQQINDQENDEGENQFLIVSPAETRRNEQGQKAQSSKTDNNVQDPDPATADNTSNKKDADVNIESAIGEEQQISDKENDEGENQFLIVSLAETRRNEQGQKAQSSKTDNNVQDQDPATADNTSNRKDADVNIESAIGEEQQISDKVKKKEKTKSLQGSEDKPTKTIPEEENSRNKQDHTGVQRSDKGYDVQVPSPDITDADTGVGTTIGDKTQKDEQVKKEEKTKSLPGSEDKPTKTIPEEENSGNKQDHTGVQRSDKGYVVQGPSPDITDADAGAGTTIGDKTQKDEQVKKEEKTKSLSGNEDKPTKTIPEEENSGNKQDHTGVQRSDKGYGVQVPSPDITDADAGVGTTIGDKTQKDEQVKKEEKLSLYQTMKINLRKPFQKKKIAETSKTIQEFNEVIKVKKEEKTKSLPGSEDKPTKTIPEEENSGNKQDHTGVQRSDKGYNVQVPSPDITDADTGEGTTIGDKTQKDEQVKKEEKSKSLPDNEDKPTKTIPEEENSGNKQDHTGVQRSDKGYVVQVPSPDITDADAGVGTTIGDKTQKDEQVKKEEKSKSLPDNEDKPTKTIPEEEHSGNKQDHTGVQRSDKGYVVQVPSPDITDADAGVGTTIGDKTQKDEQVKRDEKTKSLPGNEDKPTKTIPEEEHSGNKQDHTGVQRSDKGYDVQVPSPDITDADAGVGTTIGDKTQNDEQVKKEETTKSLSGNEDKPTKTIPEEENSGNKQDHTGVQRSDKGYDVQVPSPDITDADAGVGTTIGDKTQKDEQLKKEASSRRLSSSVREVTAIVEETQEDEQDLEIHSSDIFSLKDKKQSVNLTAQPYNYRSSPDSSVQSNSHVDYQNITTETNTDGPSTRVHSIIESEEDNQISN